MQRQNVTNLFTSSVSSALCASKTEHAHLGAVFTTVSALRHISRPPAQASQGCVRAQTGFWSSSDKIPSSSAVGDKQNRRSPTPDTPATAAATRTQFYSSKCRDSNHGPVGLVSASTKMTDIYILDLPVATLVLHIHSLVWVVSPFLD